MKHLYVVTRRDMTAGYQGVQSQHALAEFAHVFMGTFIRWKTRSNYLCWLSVKDEKELRTFARVAMVNKKLKVATFFEPDVDFEMTAIAIEPGTKAARLLKGLPLALSEFSPKAKRKK